MGTARLSKAAIRRRPSRESDGTSGGGVVGLWHAVGFEGEKRGRDGERMMDSWEYEGRGEHTEVGELSVPFGCSVFDTGRVGICYGQVTQREASTRVVVCFGK
jgi:hypothetical protein